MNRLVSLLLPLLCVILLGAAGSLHNPLLSMRKEYHLSSAPPLQNAPPVVAFATVALGGFRGIIADLLWVRMSDIQEQGRYIELVQLADWVTKLEPRSTDVWAFHAWNMAYNISVMMPSPEEKWRWVNNGISLLRNEGITCNAGKPGLYSELAWIYLDKIGGPADSAAAFYKRQFATEMMDLMGETATNTPAIKRHPEIKTKITNSGLMPSDMIELDKIYGPLDWRLPQTHALYWAFKGQQCADNKPNRDCSRIIYHAMSSLFFNGQLTYYKPDEMFITTPSFCLLSKAIMAFENAVAEGIDCNVATAYENFLITAIKKLLFFSHISEARKTFKILHKRFPSEKTANGFESYAGIPHS